MKIAMYLLCCCFAWDIFHSFVFSCLKDIVFSYLPVYAPKWDPRTQVRWKTTGLYIPGSQSWKEKPAWGSIRQACLVFFGNTKAYFCPVGQMLRLVLIWHLYPLIHLDLVILKQAYTTIQQDVFSYVDVHIPWTYSPVSCKESAYS